MVETDWPLGAYERPALGTPGQSVSLERKTMYEFDPDGSQSIDLEPRTRRALEDRATVLGGTGGVYTVVSESGKSYSVDVRGRRCTCADHKHRDATCKHLRRAILATGRAPLPAAALQVADVDPLFARHVDGPRVVAADGGDSIIEAGDEGVILSDREDGEGRDDGAETTEADR